VKNDEEGSQTKFDDGPRIDPDQAERVRAEKAQNSSGTNPAEDDRPLIETFNPEQMREYLPPEGYKLVGDYHITRGGLSLLAGAPGVGKSRVGTTLAICGAAKIPWFSYGVWHPFKTLIIQSQNGLVRLKAEYDQIGPVVDNYVLVSAPPRKGLAFNNQKFRDQLVKIIAEFQPDLIIIDPWNNVTHDITQKEYDTALNFIRMVIPAGDQSPAIFIICHTRKPQVQHRANGRELLHDVAGSYYLGAEARSVFVLLSATDSPTDNRLVMICCKNNDGELGQPRAWKPSDAGLYDEIKDFDWQSFYGRSSKKTQDGKVQRWESVAMIVFALGGQAKRSDIVCELMKRFAVSQQTAYRDFNMAVTMRRVVRIKNTDLFTVNQNM
jgi:hypothetical protein